LGRVHRASAGVACHAGTIVAYSLASSSQARSWLRFNRPSQNDKAGR